MSRSRVMSVAAAGAALVTGGALLAGSAVAASTLAVQGTVSGSYTTMQTNPDTGHGYKVNASGTACAAT